MQLDAAFQGSIYAYSKQTLYCWRGFLILCVILECVSTLISTDVEIISQTSIMRCRAIFESHFIMTVALVDIIACVVNFLLFVRQLKRVTSALGQHINLFKQPSASKSTEGGQIANQIQRKQKEDKFVAIVRKHTVLTAVGVGTTLVTLIFIGILSLSIVWYVRVFFCYLCNTVCSFHHIFFMLYN